ncbi:MAG: rhodanese-like domain-containing protein [Gammaproteobacteria bacterium]|nr:rhodanese-like domain-containing protein [Gammaproteobacteria bacterium]
MLSVIRTGVVVLALLLTSVVYAEEKPAAPDSIKGAVSVTAEEVIKLIFSNPGIVIVDSRKKTEYLKGHIEGAVNILNTVMSQQDLEQYLTDKSSAILFYCNGPRCMRSSDAVTKALSWGYTNVFWFRGGWKEWTDNRFPVITGEYLYPDKK